MINIHSWVFHNIKYKELCILPMKLIGTNIIFCTKISREVIDIFINQAYIFWYTTILHNHVLQTYALPTILLKCKKIISVRQGIIQAVQLRN